MAPTPVGVRPEARDHGTPGSWRVRAEAQLGPVALTSFCLNHGKEVPQLQAISAPWLVREHSVFLS